MGFKEVQSLDADTTIAIGGFNRKTKKDNPTSAEGYFLGTRQIDSAKSKTGKASLHFLQTAKGNLGVWGKTDMDKKLAQVKPGTMIKIAFDKMVAVPTGEMYRYKVLVDDTNYIEVGDLNATTNEPQEASEEGDRGDYTDRNTDESANEDEQDEDMAQAAALAAAERQKQVRALLSKPKTK